jgi:hypothetical protein
MKCPGKWIREMTMLANWFAQSCGFSPKDDTHRSKQYWKGIGDAWNGNMPA